LFLTLSLILAPFCSKYFTISKWPLHDAFINGVYPSLSYSIKTINHNSFNQLKIETNEQW
jgi:hypothetical protein